MKQCEAKGSICRDREQNELAEARNISYGRGGNRWNSRAWPLVSRTTLGRAGLTRSSSTYSLGGASCSSARRGARGSGRARRV